MRRPAPRLQIDLWFEPASGAYLILNDKQENMPVEAPVVRHRRARL